MIRPFGEAAYLVEVADAEQAQALAAALRNRPPVGVRGVVPGRSSVLVEVDPLAPDINEVTLTLEALAAGELHPPAGSRVREIPVVYGGRHGPDLAEVAVVAGLSMEEVIGRHLASHLRVAFLGFAPGFAYLEGLDPSLAPVRRMPTPRTRTPAGSVAIADGMSGIYPAELPGGWPVIGRTPISLFDPRREPPAYLVPGDRVRFEPIEAAEWPMHAGVPVDW